jgi:hypothetical protein
MQDGALVLDTPIVPAAYDRSIDDQDRADRDASFGEALPGLADCRFQKWIHGLAFYHKDAKTLSVQILVKLGLCRAEILTEISPFHYDLSLLHHLYRL